jgi:hypothetical protein
MQTWLPCEAKVWVKLYRTFLRLNSEPLVILAFSCLPVLAGFFASNEQRGSLFLLTFRCVYRCWAREMMLLYRMSECQHILIPAFYGAIGSLCGLSWSAQFLMRRHALVCGIDSVRRRFRLIHRLSCAVSLENTSQGDNCLYMPLSAWHNTQHVQFVNVSN